MVVLHQTSAAIAPHEREIPVGTGADWDRALAAWDNRRSIPAGRDAAGRFARIAENEDTPDAWAWCARACFFVGDYQKDINERSRWHEKGWRSGRSGVSLDSNNVGANFWTAACLASYIETLSLLRAPLYVPEGVQCLKRVADLDLEYYFAALARFLGQCLVRRPTLTSTFLQLAVPHVTPDVILTRLRHAVDEEVAFVSNVQTLAELDYAINGETRTAEEMLERLDELDLDAVPILTPENHLDLPRAKAALRKIAR